MPRSQSVSDQRVRRVTQGSAAEFAQGRASANCGPAADCGQNPQRPRGVPTRDSSLPKWPGQYRAGRVNAELVACILHRVQRYAGDARSVR
jgi:hypothetical protein